MSKPEPPTVPFPTGFDVQSMSGVRVGDVIAGDYQIERELGRGGMGVVYAARQLPLDRLVAIKLIRGQTDDDPRAVERLQREARAAGRLQSEHVVRVLGMGTLDSGAPFIVMEYLDGQDLYALLRNGALTLSLAVDYLLQACEALAEAHRNGIVHRDLKPANVFIAHQIGGPPCVKLLDFGISKVIGAVAPESLTEQSLPIGSLPYMAPEQLRGKAVDARTDIWALGALLFEMLTGQKPFRGSTFAEVCAQVLNEAGLVLDTVGLELPEELKASLCRCLRRSPEERFPNVAELAVALTPFGTSRARVSLERIVRLATSTGSLAAAAILSPAPPAAQVTHLLLPGAGKETPPVPRSAGNISTKEPVVTSVTPAPTRPFLVGTGVGIAFASAVAAMLAFWSERPEQERRALSVRSLEALPALSSAEHESALVSEPVPAPSAGLPMAPAAVSLLATRRVAVPAPALPVSRIDTRPTGRAQPLATSRVVSAAPDAGQERQPQTTTVEQAPAAGRARDLSDIGFKPKERIRR